MIDKQKVQKVIDNILKEATFQNGHWSSSQNFDTELRKSGFVPNIVLWHQYKFPKEFTEESFENYIMQQEYIHFFDVNRIMNPKQYVDKMFDYSGMPELAVGIDIEAEKKAYLFKLIKSTGVLSDEEKKYIVDYFQNEQKYAFDRIKSFLPELKKLNPEIKNINPTSIHDFFDLYIGMTSRYHPEDIEYFASLSKTGRFDEASNNQDKIKKIIGFGPNFRLAPHRVETLINGIIAQKQIISQRDI